MEFNDLLLDDAQAIEAADAGGMLLATATAGAQVRSASTQLPDVAALPARGEVRSVVICGMGGSGVAGEILKAVSGPTSPVPVVAHRGYTLPAWVGALDLVIVVSCSGSTEEALALHGEAVRRGCPSAVVASEGSPLALAGIAAGGLVVPVNPGGRQPRANLWALTVPVLQIGAAVGLCSVDADVWERLADLVDAEAMACGPMVSVPENPAKQLAYSLAGTLPLVWGCTPLMAVAALRFQAQCAENADYPVIPGELPEVNHNQVVMFDGAMAAIAPDDIFADRAERAMSLSVVLLRDDAEHDQVMRRARYSRDMAEQRGIGVHELRGAGDDPLERFAQLTARLDMASIYLAVGFGVDPSEIGPITELKERIGS